MTPQRFRRRVVTAAILCGMFLVAMDILVVSPALPAIVEDLGDIGYYAWVLSIYILASTTTVPLYGKLSDMYGRGPIYLVGMGLFISGSIASGCSVSMEMLIGSRALQGLGGGAILPVTLTIVGDLYALEERGRMQGIFSGVWGIASIVGPIIGGTLVDEVGWRWIFFINIPFGIIAAVLIRRFLREEDIRRGPHAIPYAGAILLGGAILCFLLGLLLPGMGHRWRSPEVVGLLGGSALLLLLFAAADRRAPEPILDRHLMRIPLVLSCNLAGFLVSAALYGVANYVPLYVQAVMGRTAKAAGFALTPMSLGWVFAAIVGGRVILGVGYRRLAITGLTFVATGTYLLGRIAPGSSYFFLTFTMATTGIGLGLAMTSFIIAIQNSVERERLGVATSTMQLFRMTGSVVGIAALGAVLMTTLPSEMLSDRGEVPLRTHLLEGTRAPPREFAAGMAASLRQAFVGAFLFAGAALLVGIFIPGGIAERHAHRSRRKETPEPERVIPR